MVEFAPTVKPRSARPPSISPLGALLTLFLVGYSLILAIAFYKMPAADDSAQPKPSHQRNAPAITGAGRAPST